MAIRPVDLQLAYMATPQNAAVLNAAQESPQAAQAATAAAFAAEVTRREEQVEQPEHGTGKKVQPRGERENDADGRPRKRAPQQQKAAAEEPPAGPLGLSGEDGRHFIDVTA